MVDLLPTMLPLADDRGTPDPVIVAGDRVMRHVQDQAMFLIDPRGRIASWNEGVSRIFGWAESEWIGQPVAVAFTPEDVAAGVHRRELEQAEATGRGDDDRWMLRHNGERFYAAGAVTPIRDADRRVIGFLKALRDLTEERKAERARESLARIEGDLRQRDEQWRALLEGVRDYAIYTVGLDGRISSWHEGASRMKGYSAEEAIGMPYADLFLPDDRAAGGPAHELEIAARSGEFKGEGRRLRRDGSVFDAAVVLTALHGPDGELRGYLKLSHDITQRKQQERDRDELLRSAQIARSEAERASRAKDDFLATISHELRTPLGAILGWAHVLERGRSDADGVRQGLSAITRNARAQVQLIEDLLDMNRIESGRLRLEMQPVELAVVIAAAADAIRPAAETKGVGFRLLLDPALGEVRGDAGRLQQVVWNLLSNAVKFTPAGGTVTVTAERAGPAFEVCVRDTGQGIRPEFLGRMFDRFQQEDGSTTRRHGGLGLGLAIVRELTQLHGGSVLAESPGPGEGATFTLTLPIPDAAATPAHGARPASTDAEAEVRLDGLTVLLIDDEPDARAIAEHVLRTAGATVLSASSAQQGLALLRAHRPQAILSDIGMPEHDGYDFMRWVRALGPEEGGRTPAAAFTAYARPEDARMAHDAGFQVHLVKPIEPAALVAAVARLVAG